MLSPEAENEVDGKEKERKKEEERKKKRRRKKEEIIRRMRGIVPNRSEIRYVCTGKYITQVYI